MKKIISILFASSWLMAMSSMAQDNFPSKTVNIVVAYTPGGPSDTVARLLGRSLAKQWGQPVIIENRPGANSVIGTGHALRQTPDGHTLLVAPAQLVTNTAMGVPAPYNPTSDLTPIATLSWMPILLAVNPNVPAKNLPGLLEWMRKQPKPVQFATSGEGGLTHFWAEFFAQHYKLPVEHVPYKGSADAARAAVAGDLPMLIDGVGITASMISSGKLTGILSPGSQRVPGLPALPSAAESGLPKELIASSFIGLVGPANLPKATLDKINAAVNRALADPEVISALNGLGMSPAGGTPADFANLLASELKRWTEVGRSAGIKASK
jgi:tripartite-type tricarboxylate transporter receptor subunit TctC